MPRAAAPTPAIVIYGDEPYQRSAALQRSLDELCPPRVDRSLAVCSYDGTKKDDDGGPALGAVLEDLRTLPFLAEHRVVVIRDADAFITAHRDALERYFAAPSKTGVLILDCRSFPRTTRLYKAIDALGGRLIECKKLVGRALVDFVVSEVRAGGKRIEPTAAARLVELIGQEQGMLAGEVEKLCLYALDRPTISDDDVAALVGLSREEKIFAVLDAAALGRLSEALRLWHQLLETDPAAPFKIMGGVAFTLRKWLTAHQLQADGLPLAAIAPKLMMFRREQDLATILRRLPPVRLQRLLAEIALLDAQAKSGARSIEMGIEGLLIGLATVAA